MIHFLTKAAHLYTLKEVSAALPIVQVKSYEEVMKGNSFLPGTYVFTDIDRLTFGEQIAASKLYRALKAEPRRCRVFNDPARVKTRFSLLRSLYLSGHNKFNAYRADEHTKPQQFPVFIRYEHEHTAPLSDLLHTQAELEQALSQLVTGGAPERALLISEFCAEPAAPGLFRKIAAYRIGDRIVPANTVHDSNWCVKYGKTGGGTAALYADELDMIQSNRYEQELRPVFEVANIEYGRVDFGVVGGKVTVYEINTNPKITAPTSHPSDVRMQSQNAVWHGLLAALAAIDHKPA